jgi:hypothetical protein
MPKQCCGKEITVRLSAQRRSGDKRETSNATLDSLADDVVRYGKTKATRLTLTSTERVEMLIQRGAERAAVSAAMAAAQRLRQLGSRFRRSIESHPKIDQPMAVRLSAQPWVPAGFWRANGESNQHPKGSTNKKVSVYRYIDYFRLNGWRDAGCAGSLRG